MDEILKFITLFAKLIFFVALSIIFLPSFFIVTYTQELWSKLLTELFNV